MVEIALKISARSCVCAIASTELNHVVKNLGSLSSGYAVMSRLTPARKYSFADRVALEELVVVLIDSRPSPSAIPL